MAVLLARAALDLGVGFLAEKSMMRKSKEGNGEYLHRFVQARPATHIDHIPHALAFGSVRVVDRHFGGRLGCGANPDVC